MKPRGSVALRLRKMLRACSICKCKTGKRAAARLQAMVGKQHITGAHIELLSNQIEM